jgi:transketolase
MSAEEIEQLAVNTIRALSIDAVQKANSGHPGAPMALAPVAYAIWQHHLRYDPRKPAWADRDRFVLSNGHASMLLYSMIFLTEIQATDRDGHPLGRPSLSLDEIERFRQLGSKTPGHPEYGHTTGVETTTGPLGQGVSTSVGMAMAERFLAERFNRPGHNIVDHRHYVVCGDGDMMEGVSSEAASLAGHLELSRLCWIYDSNRISIEGSTGIAFTEDTARRFEAYGWHVDHVDDANDIAALDAALERFKSRDDKPTLIVVRSVIGYGAPHKQGTREAHGEPLGEEEVRLAKRFYGWPEDAKFLVPEGVIEHFRSGIGARGAALTADWERRFAAYRQAFPELAEEFERLQQRRLPEGWDAEIPSFPTDAKGLATRDSSGTVLNAIARRHPWLLGGAADLAPSTKTNLKFDEAGTYVNARQPGRNIHFGVREHAMGCAVNGMVLSGLRAYGSGFLIFSDYMKAALRLAALMEIPSIFIFTHDSIGVGEDGPTHQPIEQLITLRATPNMLVIRPADANEVAEAWRAIMAERTQPVALILSRQALPTLDRTRFAPASGLARGGYVLADPADGAAPEVILIGTGSELQLCVAAHERLAAEGVRSRVVSLPSWELFDAQPEAYRHAVLPPAIRARVSVEAGSTMGWERYVGIDGARIGMTGFGASAPIKDLMNTFGFTVDHVYEAARQQLARG